MTKTLKVALAGAGHISNMDRPAEFTRAVREFLGAADAALRAEVADRLRASGNNVTKVARDMGKARQQVVGSAFGTEFVELGEGPAVLLHLLGAEQLRAQGRGVAVLAGAVSGETQMPQILDDGLAAFLEFSIAFV